MKILSIDVGIKNLAYVLIDKQSDNSFIITKWEVIDLSKEEHIKCECGKNANYIDYNTNKCCCKKHVKLPIIKNELLMKNLKKKKIDDIRCELNNAEIIFDNKLNKMALLESIENALREKYAHPYSTKINAKDINLIDIGINLKYELNEKLKDEEIDVVIIENQISPLAQRMKTLQGMITQYFIMNNIEKIEFISASNKLKEFLGNKKTEYSERKKESCEICRTYLEENDKVTEYLEYFCSHKKKDDLADCLLQVLWYIKNK